MNHTIRYHPEHERFQCTANDCLESFDDKGKPYSYQSPLSFNQFLMEQGLMNHTIRYHPEHQRQ